MSRQPNTLTTIPPEQTARYPLDGKLDGPQSHVTICTKRILSLSGIEVVNCVVLLLIVLCC